MIIIYEGQGEITQTVFDPVPADYEDFLTANGTPYVTYEGRIGTDIYTDFYVADGELTSRPAFDVPAEVVLQQGETFETEVPPETTVRLEDGEIVTLDGVLEIEGETRGTFEFPIECFPYKSMTIQVTVQ